MEAVPEAQASGETPDEVVAKLRQKFYNFAQIYLFKNTKYAYPTN